MIEVNKKHYGTWGVFMRPMYSKKGQHHDSRLGTYLYEPNAVQAAADLQEHDQNNDRDTEYYVQEVPFIDRS